jgi:hypothetical protein
MLRAPNQARQVSAARRDFLLSADKMEHRSIGDLNDRRAQSLGKIACGSEYRCASCLSSLATLILAQIFAKQQH